MVAIGQHYTLKIVKDLPQGLYLEAEDTEILLPRKEVPAQAAIGDTLRVFVYRDSDSRPVATLHEPALTLNHFAALKVADINRYGAFLEWGVPNQLLMPYSEMPLARPKAGDTIVVQLLLDAITDRLIASAAVERRLKKNAEGQLKAGDQVSALLYRRVLSGWRAIIDNQYTGILYDSDIYRPVKEGALLEAWVKTIRDDGKIDLTLRRTGRAEREEAAEKLLDLLTVNNGCLDINDSSTPEQIEKVLHMSKKAYKRAAGILYKERLIRFTEKGMELIKSPAQSDHPVVPPLAGVPVYHPPHKKDQ